MKMCLQNITVQLEQIPMVVVTIHGAYIVSFSVESIVFIIIIIIIIIFYQISHFSALAGKYSPILECSNQQD